MPSRPTSRSVRPDAADRAAVSHRTRAGLAVGASIAVATAVLITPVAAVAADTPAPGASTPAPGATTPAPGATTPAPGATTPAPGATTPAPTVPPTPAPTPSPTQVRLPKPRTWVTARLTWPTGVPGSPDDGTRVGVGILPVLRFSHDIPRKSVVEQAIRVSSPKGKLPRGSWAWTDDRTAVYRTKRFWPGKSRIDISVDLVNQVLGKVGGRYLIGAQSLGTTYSFRTARSFIAYVNASTAQMRVTIDGTVTKRFGVSLGKAGWESRSGIKVYYGSKEATHTYTNDALGVEEEYTLTAPWNVRLTPTGEFIHTAQWAYSRIGRYNGSHGCTNMFEADAKWIYDRVLPGDVFKYTGTSKPMESTNGPLALWNIPWSDWQERSALA